MARENIHLLLAARIWDYITDNQNTPFDEMSETTNIPVDTLRLLALLCAKDDKERFSEIVATLPRTAKIPEENNYCL